MIQLPERELAVLHRLGSFRYLTTRQIERFLFDGSALRPKSREVVTQRLLGRLRRRGLVATTPRIIGGPGGGSVALAYLLTASGQVCIAALSTNARARPRARATWSVQHAVTAADVALAFQESARERNGHDVITWESDGELAAALAGSAVIPDARIVYATKECELDAFIEIDLGTERPAVFAAKVAAYLDLYGSGTWRERLATWPLVLTIAPTAVRAVSLRRTTEAVLRAVPDGDALALVTEFCFAVLSHLLDAGPLGEIWQVAGRVGFHRLVAADTAVDGVATECSASPTNNPLAPAGPLGPLPIAGRSGLHRFTWNDGGSGSTEVKW